VLLFSLNLKDTAPNFFGMKNFSITPPRLICLTLAWMVAGNAKSQDLQYLNTDLPIGERVGHLVSGMTLEQKISQMQNGAAAIPELNIPEYDWWNECLHGVARNGIATVFPQAIGMAATWNPELIREEAEIISTEARAKYHEAERNNERRRYQGLTMWSPNINIFRDPRWGRGQETYGEDPYLTSRVGVAFVRGLQGEDPRYFKVVSTPKHFAVHSGPEPLRHSFDVDVSDRDLHETYLPAFKACIVEAGAYSVMGAYNRFRGESCSAHPLLLQKMLREEWGFTGYVVSDCGAIRDIFRGHNIAGDAAEASALAVKNGCDLTCGQEYRALKEAVEKGLITEEEIDVSVKRLMEARFRLGMFDAPELVPYAQIPFEMNDAPQHDSFALKVARESMVLLKNENHTLPLSEEARFIAVVGPYADNLDVLLGNYNGIPSDPVTILQGIRNRSGDQIRVEYAQGVLPPESVVRADVIPEQVLRPGGIHSGNGLVGEYFDNPDLHGEPVVVRIDPVIQHFWRQNGPAAELPADSFSIRWTGTLTPTATGSYEIGLFTDERGRFYLDDQLVINNWESHTENFNGTDTVRLEKGQEYRVMVEYADLSGFAGNRLTWRRIDTPADRQAMLDEAVDLVGRSDVAIVVAGISPRLEGEEMRIRMEGFDGGDRTTLQLPESMKQLIRSVHGTGKPVILVMTSGSALAVNWEEANLPAIMQVWYPGQQGGNAVADVIFGHYNPAGRLPVTYYKSVEDLPHFEDYDMEGRTYRYFRGDPLYAFGHGLSFSEFKYEQLRISNAEVSESDTIMAEVTVTNRGPVGGDEVIQLYVRDLESNAPQPLKSLRGFRRVHIENNQSRTVGIPLAIHDLAYYSETKQRFLLEHGEFELQVGASSSDIRLSKVITVTPPD
jgi:beta-glucosidase